jgi:hypothetical protein
MLIKVGQHIFGNLEKEASPRRIGGFQTIAYTQAMLGEPESGEIEKRLVYNFSEIEPVKLLSFSLNNKYVISRLIPLPDLDRFGRKGIYLAQSFIISLEEFRQLDCNPFIALNLLQERFINSNLEALNLINPGGIDINSLDIESGDDIINSQNAETLKETKKWDIEELKKLAFTALNSAKFKFERKSIALIGKPENIESAINVALLLLPDKNKLDCSFDTYSCGCNPIANYFWALGYPSTPSSSLGFILADSVQRNVKLSSYIPDSCYGNWLFTSIAQRKYTEIISHKTLASELQNLLTGDNFDKQLLQSASENFLQEYFELNWSFVIKEINDNLKKKLGASLALNLQDIALRHYQRLDPGHLLALLIAGLDMQLLINDLYKAIKNKRPSEAELYELGNLLKANKHDLLSILYNYWKKNVAELQRKLDGLDEKLFSEVIEQLIKDNYMPVLDYISHSKTELTIKIYSNLANKDRSQTIQVPQMVRSLVKLRQDVHLKTLIPFLTFLNIQQLREIEKEWGKSNQSISRPFFQSAKDELTSKEKEEKSKRSISGMFNKVFKKRD